MSIKGCQSERGQSKTTTNIREKCALIPIVSANTARQTDGPWLSSARLIPDVNSMSGMDGR